MFGHMLKDAKLAKGQKYIEINPMLPLHPTDITTEPWETISVNIIGPLLHQKDFNAILVIMEYLTKMKILVPFTTKITSSRVAIIFH